MDYEIWTSYKQVLADSILFKGLDEAALQAVTTAGKLKRFDAGTSIFYEGELAEVAYVILEGWVRLFKINEEGHKVIIQMLQAGAPLSVLALICEMGCPVSAEAVEAVTVLTWPKAVFNTLREKHTRISHNSINLLAQRFKDLQLQHMEMVTQRVERRIACAMVRLAEKAGKQVADGILVDFTLSRQDIAHMTGTTIYTVSRVLSEWEQQGFVKTGRGFVLLRSVSDILLIAEDLPDVTYLQKEMLKRLNGKSDVANV